MPNLNIHQTTQDKTTLDCKTMVTTRPWWILAQCCCTDMHSHCKQAINRGYPFGSPYHLSFFLGLAPHHTAPQFEVSARGTGVVTDHRQCPFLYIDVGNPHVAAAVHPVAIVRQALITDSPTHR